MHERHVARICAPTLLEVWILYQQKRKLSKKTVRMYEFVWRWGLSDWMDRPITSISKTEIEDRHKELSQKKGPRGEGKASADLCMRTLRSMINFANQRYEQPNGKRLIEQNPVKWLSEIKGWNPRIKRKDVISVQNLPKFFQVVENAPDKLCRDYLLVIMFTGFRRTEAAKLQWKDVDFHTLQITARFTKNKMPHTLPLCPYLINLLTHRYWFMRPAPDDYIFPGRNKGESISEYYTGYESLFEPLGFKFMPHTLRRTFLTTATACHVDYVHIQWLANHTISDVTWQYLIKDPEILREDINRVSERLLELAGINQS